MDTTLTSSSSSSTSLEPWLESLARFGYAAKGVVYAAIGVLAIQAAFMAGQIEGSKEAIATLGSQPMGQVTLVLIVLGLVGYVVWQFTRAAADPEHVGDDAEGVAKRIAYAASGVTYGFLAIATARMVFGASSSSGSQGNGAVQEWGSTLLAQDWGVWVLGAIGVGIFIAGIYHGYKALDASFMERLKIHEMSATEQTWAERIGRFGMAARGVVFLLIGIFCVDAARSANAGEITSIAGALRTLEQQPYGAWLLGAVAFGLLAYGIHCFLSARYRRIQTSS